MKHEPPLDGADRLSASWRAVAAAWVFVILLVVFSAGAEALAARHSTAPRAFTGAVIPRHDSACDRIPSDECPGFASTLAEMQRYGSVFW